MLDLIYLATILLLFALAIAYLHFCARLRKEEKRMNLETIAAILCSVFLLAYLVYALLRPEKF